MIRSLFRRGLRLGIVVGALVFLVQVLLRRQPQPADRDTGTDTAPAPRPGGPATRPVDRTGNGSTAALVATPRAEPASATAAPLTESTSAGQAVSAKTAPEPSPAVTEPALASEVAEVAEATPKAKAKPAAEPKAKAKKAAKATKTAKASKAAKATKAAKSKAAAPTSLPAWVEPVEGAAPATHPVKAKVASKIYHLPGMTAYDRTTPDRCYRDAETAEADGFRKAQR